MPITPTYNVAEDRYVPYDTLAPYVHTAPNANTLLFFEYAQDSITATPSGTQANSFQILGQTARVATVVTAGDGVLLPPAAAGLDCMVINDSANGMTVFGSGTDTIDGSPLATGVWQMGKSVVIYVCVTPGTYRTEGSATGWWGPGLQSQSWQDNIIAFATGGQTSATLLTRMINRVVTVATAADSVKFSPTLLSAGGCNQTVINAHASNALALFPSAGESINALANNASFSVPANKTATGYMASPGIWHVVLSA
jgi:hypothetical protein